MRKNPLHTPRIQGIFCRLGGWKNNAKTQPSLRRVAIRKFWFISTASTHLDNEKISQYDKYSLIFIIANLNEINQNELRSTSNPIFLCKKKAKAVHKADAYGLLLTNLLCEKIEFWGKTFFSSLSGLRVPQRASDCFMVIFTAVPCSKCRALF